MGAFHIFQIVEMVPNRAKRHIYSYILKILKNFNTNILNIWFTTSTNKNSSQRRREEGYPKIGPKSEDHIFIEMKGNSKRVPILLLYDKEVLSLLYMIGSAHGNRRRVCPKVGLVLETGGCLNPSTNYGHI